MKIKFTELSEKGKTYRKLTFILLGLFLISIGYSILTFKMPVAHYSPLNMLCTP